MGISRWAGVLGRLIGLGLIVVLAGGLGGCRGDGEAGEKSAGGDMEEMASSDGEDGEEGEEDEEEAVPVALASLGRGRIESVLRFSTNLEAEREVQVLAESTREVRQLLVEEGDRVSRGAVLIRLEDDEQRTELERIEGQIAKAQR